MTPSYENGYDYYNGDSVTPDYHEYGDFGPRTPGGLELVFFISLVYLILPLVVILNLILFIKIVRTKKIRSEPWRWLIANTSFCMIITAVMEWNTSLTKLHFVPSLTSMPACYFFLVISSAAWFMTIVSFSLVIIERVHALRLGVENGGSFSKSQVILCLVPFWLILIIVSVLPVFLVPLLQGIRAIDALPDGRCFIHNPIENITLLIVWIWAFPTFIVVFIGTLVFKGRKTTTDSMKQSNVNPTLALSCFGFFFMMLPITLFLAASEFPRVIDFFGHQIFFVTAVLSALNTIIFPVIWLVTWSRNGDISLRCCRGEDEEHKRLLDHH